MSFRDWIELESDPGLFTLLVYDFDVQNVEVEEVYDLTKPIERSVYGFIFLFKWTEERKSRRKAVVPEENFVYDENIETDMFFAQQIIPDSCASHALLSVLLNVPDIKLGYTLRQLRDSCKGFDAETKGYAIGNFWNISVAHNNHGRPELRWQLDRLKNVTAASRSMEAFHYVSYIPHNGRLFELDGLKPHPIDHGPLSADESWSDKARRVIQERIQLATGGELSHDIRYNLLAVVPEQRQEYKQKMDILSHNKKVLIELFKKLATKESFIKDLNTSSIMKQNNLTPPFTRHSIKSKKVSFGDHPNSPLSSCSSTMTGTESPSHPFSDSEDSSVETYRVKSIMRGTMKGPVYVYGDMESCDDVKSDKHGELEERASKDVASQNIFTDIRQDGDDKNETDKRKHDNSESNVCQITDIKQYQEDCDTKRIKLTIKRNPKKEIDSELIKASFLSQYPGGLDLNPSVVTSDILNSPSLSVTNGDNSPSSVKDTQDEQKLDAVTDTDDGKSSVKIFLPSMQNKAVFSHLNTQATGKSSLNVKENPEIGLQDAQEHVGQFQDSIEGSQLDHSRVIDTKWYDVNLVKGTPAEEKQNKENIFDNLDNSKFESNRTNDSKIKTEPMDVEEEIINVCKIEEGINISKVSETTNNMLPGDIKKEDKTNNVLYKENEGGEEMNARSTMEGVHGKSEDNSKEVEDKPGLGVEIIADDADIESLLDQNRMEKLCLEHIMKYESKIRLQDVQKCMQDLDEIYKSCEVSYKEELEKIETYKIDDCRRRHNYDPFVSTFLTMLAEQGHLAKLLEQQNTVIRRVSNAWVKGNGGKKEKKKKKKKLKKGSKK